MTLITAFTMVSFVAAPVPKTDPVKTAQAALQGEWKVGQYIAKGRLDEVANVPTLFIGSAFDPPVKNNWLDKPEKTKCPIVFIKGDQVTADTPCGDEVLLIFTLAPKTTIPSIDIKPTKKPLTFKGIYKLEKDTLTIYYAFEKRERPEKFEPEEKIHGNLVVLERVKK